MQQPEKNERPAQIAEPPIPDVVPYRPAVQTEDRKEAPLMPSLKIGRIPQYDESEAKEFTVIQKGARKKLEDFPPLKRAVIWSEILGPPRGWSPD